MYINKGAMLSNVYDICTVVAYLRVSHAQEQSVRIHQDIPAILAKLTGKPAILWIFITQFVTIRGRDGTYIL